MTELLKKLFQPKKYWEGKVHECHDAMLSAEFKWKKAIKWHEKSKHLRVKYELARLNFEKAWKKYTTARGF
jgi:hypothetical protein